MKVITREALPSPCPMPGREARITCIGLVQTRWYDAADAHTEQLREGVSACAGAGANVVFLPELTLCRYPADRRPEGPANASAEDLESGPSLALARELARECDVHVQISLFERSGAADQRGLNSSIIVAPNGECVGRTRKLHIPVTEGYFEDHYFTEGPADDPYPVHSLELDGVASRWATRPAGMSGSLKWRVAMHSPALTCSVTPPPSAPNPTTRISTPHHC